MIPVAAVLLAAILTWPARDSASEGGPEHENHPPPLTDWDKKGFYDDDGLDADVVHYEDIPRTNEFEVIESFPCTPTTFSAVPYLVEIWDTSTSKFLCHGTIVTPVHVLTKWTRVSFRSHPNWREFIVQLQPIKEYRSSVLSMRWARLFKYDKFCFGKHKVVENVPHPKAESDRKHFNFVMLTVDPKFSGISDFASYPVLDIGSTPYELLLKIRSANYDPRAGCASPMVRPVTKYEFQPGKDETWPNKKATKVHRLVGIPFFGQCVKKICEFELNYHMSAGAVQQLSQSHRTASQFCIAEIEAFGESMHLCMRSRGQFSVNDDSQVGLPVICEGIAVGMVADVIPHPDGLFWHILTYLRIYPWLHLYMKDNADNLQYDPVLRLGTQVTPDIIVLTTESPDQ